MAKKATTKSKAKRTTKTSTTADGKKGSASTAPAVGRKDWNIVGRQELAQLMGVHPDTVTDYARSDMPVITRGGRGKESEYDAIECLSWQRQKMGRNALENAKTKATELQAQLSEIKIAKEMGELISREEAASSGRKYTAAWRAMVLAFPRLLFQTGAIERHQEPLIAKACREILSEIASWKTEEDCVRVTAAAEDDDGLLDLEEES